MVCVRCVLRLGGVRYYSDKEKDKDKDKDGTEKKKVVEMEIETEQNAMYRQANELTALEGLRTRSGGRLIRPALVASVEEFFGRLAEEMDYERELRNLRDFDALYGRGGAGARVLRAQAAGGEIVTPAPWVHLCSARVALADCHEQCMRKLVLFSRRVAARMQPRAANARPEVDAAALALRRPPRAALWRRAAACARRPCG